MTQYLLGIDAGNTLVKAVLFGLDGREIAVEHREAQTHQPRPGHVERDIEEMRSCTAAAIQGCLAKSGARAADIVAVGCAGHGNGIYLLDRNDAPLLGIQSLDSRSADLVNAWHADGTAERICALNLQKPWPSQTATLFSWLKRNQPALFARAGRVLCCKDVIVHFLTGHVGSDYSDMSGGGLLRLPARTYDDELMAALDLADCRRLLAPIAESTDIIGQVTSDAALSTGLKAGTPVVAGLFDVVASALGSGVTLPGMASIVAGTWSINQVVTREPLPDSGVFVTSTFRADRYMEIEASATSATNLEWFLREFMADGMAAMGRAATFDLCNELVSAIVPATDLPLYHPFIYGSADSSVARAGFYGMGGWHTRAHLIYAVMEGVAFGHRLHIEKLRNVGATISTAMLSGGASRSAAWAQIFANVLGIDIATAESQETGALGAAMAAGIGVGVFRDFEDAASTVKVQRRYAPHRDYGAILNPRYALFSDIAAAMKSRWERFRPGA